MAEGRRVKRDERLTELTMEQLTDRQQAVAEQACRMNLDWKRRGWWGVDWMRCTRTNGWI